ncbi:MAG: hypothetical protein K0R84_1648 [Clostridia bacterium]|jgi:hypothetical protein|nr:hypothetical protein [Clostridia bacterium]
MNYLNVEASQHEMKLIQMGAAVEQVNSKTCYVRFVIDNIPVEYVYNINKKNKYFLERIKPYPLPLKTFENEADIVDIIYIDIKQFKNAVKSRNIDSFVGINKELNYTIKKFEDLFLYYNVPSLETEKIMNKIKEINDIIINTKETSERLFFEKEPEHLR